MTNIFISDVTNHHKTSLRADAQSHAALDPELAGSFRFFSLGTRAFNIIANFCNENRGFTRMLATVSARFNPVAAYYKNPHKAFEMAANGDAENVFEGMAPLDYVRKGGVWEHIIPYGVQVRSWPPPSSPLEANRGACLIEARAGYTAGRTRSAHGVLCSPAPTRGAGSSSRTLNAPSAVSTL